LRVRAGSRHRPPDGRAAHPRRHLRQGPGESVTPGKGVRSLGAQSALIPRTQPLLGPTGVGMDEQVLASDGLGRTYWATMSGGVTDHGALTGLSDDDHSQYALLAGRSGGQTLTGGTAAGENLTLQSTSDATKGKTQFGSVFVVDESNARIGSSTTAPVCAVDHVTGN